MCVFSNICLLGDSLKSLNQVDSSSFVHWEDTYRTLRLRGDTPAVYAPDIGNTLEVRQG